MYDSVIQQQKIGDKTIKKPINMFTRLTERIELELRLHAYLM